MTTRRAFLANAAGLGAALAAADWSQVNASLAWAAQASSTTPPPPFTALTAEEAREVEAMASRIMPTTDTPGAKEAGVVWFVDKALATWGKDIGPPIFRKGFPDLRKRVARRRKGATSFAALSPADQDAVLRGMEKTEFFGAVHFLTMAGMFADPVHGGNRNRVGWKMIGFEPKPVHHPPFGYYDSEAMRGGKP
jgi:gluconate 2-dehydrogenase gamma chain